MQFFMMHGYGWYIWPAYGIVISSLFSQWIVSWLKYKKSKRNHE